MLDEHRMYQIPANIQLNEKLSLVFPYSQAPFNLKNQGDIYYFFKIELWNEGSRQDFYYF